MTDNSVELGYVDQGYTGDQAAQNAAAYHRRLEVVKLPEAKKGFVLLPKRWVAERSNAWTALFCRLERYYKQSATTRAALHFVAFAMLTLKCITRSME